MARQKYLLDTNICAFLLRGKYNLAARIDQIGIKNCCISEVTVAELKYGKILGMLKGGPKYKDQNLESFLSTIKVYCIESALDLYAEEKARLQLVGTPADEFDLLIGCTAVVHNMIMVTQNVKDFKNIRNIKLENWLADGE